ncbi:hypothetical protein MC885_014460 [Smutsia gigantea]|nr:hypothetical protein MC885_014460 [Smutsia gigantea]
MRHSEGLSAHILSSYPSLQPMTPKATRGPNAAAPKEEIGILSHDEGEASEVDSKEECPGGWVPQLLRRVWLGWFSAPDIPKTQSQE